MRPVSTNAGIRPAARILAVYRALAHAGDQILVPGHQLVSVGVFEPDLVQGPVAAAEQAERGLEVAVAEGDDLGVVGADLEDGLGADAAAPLAGAGGIEDVFVLEEHVRGLLLEHLVVLVEDAAGGVDHADVVVTVGAVHGARAALHAHEHDVDVVVVLLLVEAGRQRTQQIVPSRRHAVGDDRRQSTLDRIGVGRAQMVAEGCRLGIAGVQGNGQSELVEALPGLLASQSGSVLLAGEDITTRSPRAIHNRGVAHVPEDRQLSGLVLPFTITENIVLDSYHNEPISNGIRMDWNAARDRAERLVEQYDVRTPSTEVNVSTLSGGNQQKVIVAREFDRDVSLVIASQPTRGIDVGSIEYIHSRIVEERDLGAAVLIVSSELDEITALSDRILVMFEGQIVAEFDGSASTTDIGLAMLGSAQTEGAS